MIPFCWDERHPVETWNARLGVMIRWRVCPHCGHAPARLSWLRLR